VAREDNLTAEQVRAIRQRFRLTQAELAEVLGISWRQMARIEGNDSPCTITMGRLLWFLQREGIPEHWLPRALRSTAARLADGLPDEPSAR
jgi:transcriptional regulator with XRE-family HTH domain